jgi:hypothetical protein
MFYVFQQVENVETAISNSQTQNVSQIIFLLMSVLFVVAVAIVVVAVVVLTVLPDNLDRIQHGPRGRRRDDDDGGVRVVQLSKNVENNSVKFPDQLVPRI